MLKSNPEAGQTHGRYRVPLFLPAAAAAAAAAGCDFSSSSSNSPLPPASPREPAPSKPAAAAATPRRRHLASYLTTKPTNAIFCAFAAVLRTAMAYTARHVGAPNSLGYRVFLENDGVTVSPFHDIPLHPANDPGVYNMVVEIPRWTNAKLEVRRTRRFRRVSVRVSLS
ncbi:MAG: inorganic pyrophosphatase [Olpidium bornovanus]|uniref:inorganic diphosphatase n=1 Tax=Olpidium bornovanus TaxID=278681 RepID=A0A8H8DMR9_9FUNG|nr:MAG: inorganic pyrophosphatase [Olpidium bornovanus]